MKILKTFGILCSLTGVSLVTQAAECTAHISTNSDNTVTYSNQAYIPNIHLNPTAARQGYLMVHNISDEQVNVKIDLKYKAQSTGLVSSVDTTSVHAIYSTSNDPRAVSGASMPANSYGQVNIAQTSTPHNLTGTISWEASQCVKTPLLVTLEHYSTGSKDIEIHPMNGGVPF